MAGRTGLVACAFLFFCNVVAVHAEQRFLHEIPSCTTDEAMTEHIVRIFGKERASWFVVQRDINSRSDTRVCDFTMTEYEVVEVMTRHQFGNYVIELVRFKTTFMMVPTKDGSGFRESSWETQIRYSWRVRKGIGI